MKKQLSTIAIGLALFGCFGGYSQNAQTKIPCYTDEAMEQVFQSNPQARKNYEAAQEGFRAEYQKNLSGGNAAGKTAAVVYTVPVVFHILHQGGAENIADQVCIDALNWINGDYAKTHGDASLTAAPFSSLYIASDIQMMLAKKDPSGNCTSGIVHHYDSRTNWDQNLAGSASYWTHTWDPTKYLNVYIVAQIIPQGTVTGGGIIVGYTFRPGTWGPGDARDAIVYNYGFLGVNPGNPDARSLSHEMGHWFNLAHTFGNTNNPGVSCGDDGIADTPPTKGEFGTCPTSLSGNACYTVNGTNNVQNIMNYSGCPINFTQNQTTAMRTALGSTISGRSNVISASNLTLTNVNGAGVCSPAADFVSTTNNFTICSGGSLSMKDASYYGPITGWSWSATNGANIASPSSSLTAISFPSVGTSVITLTATNAQGSSSISRTVTVISGAVGVPPDYFESFEAPGIPNNWVVTNPDAGSITWAQTNLGASDGSNSYYIEGFSDLANKIDYLQMPIIDPLDNPNDTIFTFKYAYARYDANNNDKLEVQGSVDCGGTWQTILSLSAIQMANGSGGINSNPYFPAASEWKKVNIYNYFVNGGGPYLSSPSVLVRFKFTEGTTGHGNRLYIDEVDFTSVSVGINELTKSIRFSMYPNPTTSEATVKFNLNDAANVKVTVTDILGNIVLPSVENNYSPGEQSITINKNNTLSKGVYFVNLSLNGAKMCQKLIIK